MYALESTHMHTDTAVIKLCVVVTRTCNSSTWEVKTEGRLREVLDHSRLHSELEGLEMAQWYALIEDPGSVPSIYMMAHNQF